MMNITSPTLISVCKSLSIPAEWLWMLINFESKWNPLAKAGYPYNKAKVDRGEESPKYARGLIQFIDPTARDLGYASADDLVSKHPTMESQLKGPVFQYLKRYSPFPTEQSLYLSVFYPAARNRPTTWQFPDSVRSANPGIGTPGDYVELVKRIGGKGLPVNDVIKGGAVVMVVLGVLVLKKLGVF